MPWRDDLDRFGILHRAERVLVVDDDDSTRRVLTAVLHRRGFGVLPVADAWEALEALRTFGVDVQVVLTDVRMPGIAGDLLIQNVGARYPWIGVVAMTAWPDREVERACADAGADAFLAKPFPSIDALVSAVRLAVARRRGRPRPAPVVGRPA